MPKSVWKCLMLAAALQSAGSFAAGVADSAVTSPLLAIDRHRASVVQRVVADWASVAASLPADRRLTAEQLSDALFALRADRLLTASLAGSFSAIEAILAEDRADREASSRVNQKHLGDAAADLTYTPVNPCRIVDTRGAGGPLLANAARTFDGFSANFATQGGAAGNCGMPNGVAAVAMNVYAVNPTNLGFIKLWPANGAEPAVSTVNYQTGIVAIATGTIVPVDTANNNQFSAKSPANVDLIVDVVGYFAPPEATLLSCTTIANQTNVAPGSGLQGTLAACPATHSLTGGGCTFFNLDGSGVSAADDKVSLAISRQPFDSNTQQFLPQWACAYVNNDAVKSYTVAVRARCCRVPGR